MSSFSFSQDATREDLPRRSVVENGDRSSGRAASSRIYGHGEMADLTRAHDWARTPLGPVENWSDTLITTVNQLLASRHAMFLFWGPELIQFYNDGYRPSLASDKHPAALGHRGRECWPEIWPAIGPQIESVMGAGESTWHENQLLPIYRDGQLVDVYWTYSYSPVRDGNGTIWGVLVVCTDTTTQVLNEQRLRAVEAALRAANEDLEKRVAQRTSALEAEILERKRAEVHLRELTGRLLQMQDQERRKMARELHDHAGQTLVALSMNLAALRDAARSKENAGSKEDRIVELSSDCEQLSEDLSREIRTLSYLLHPPLLDEAGLTSALSWYVEGFTKRSKIPVELEVADGVGRLSNELELVIFRVVQECLTNVHRHSGSPSAKIRLERVAGGLQLEVSDCGQGIPPERLQRMQTAETGVGVRGMEERIRQFGGTLSFTSSPQGTQVAVYFPLESTADKAGR